MCVWGGHAGEVNSGKDELLCRDVPGRGLPRGTRCLLNYQELICCSRRPNVSTNLHPPPTPSGDDSWPHCDWPPTKRDGLGRWRLSNPTSSPAPRAVKMPTFGRVVVVFVSPFRQASPGDRNNSPLTLIVRKCGRYVPLSCVCSSVRVCSVTSEEKINQRLFPVKPLFQFPVVPSQSCGLLSSHSPFFCPKLTLLNRNHLKILVLALSRSHLLHVCANFEWCARYICLIRGRWEGLEPQKWNVVTLPCRWVVPSPPPLSLLLALDLHPLVSMSSEGQCWWNH